MSYVMVESSVARHRKFVKAGPAASWLWLCGLAYCQEGLTDGFIPEEALDYLGVKKPRQLVALLVSAGLWEPVEGEGWQVHDYLEHNNSSDHVRHIQKERKASGSKGGRTQANNRRLLKQKLEQKLETELNPATATATATATEPVASQRPHTRTRPATLVSPRRLDAAWEGPIGLYVLQKQHRHFVDLRRGNEAELLAWYGQVADEWESGARSTDQPDPDMFKFWTARYSERWPATPAKSAAPTGPKTISAHDHPYAKQYIPTGTGS